uniref:Uncharacterized protein n=1 Tax=Salix viminalis TaxID=40686 RepID=A0A6N2MWK0_SALVM
MWIRSTVDLPICSSSSSSFVNILIDNVTRGIRKWEQTTQSNSFSSFLLNGAACNGSLSLKKLFQLQHRA